MKKNLISLNLPTKELQISRRFEDLVTIFGCYSYHGTSDQFVVAIMIIVNISDSISLVQ